MYFTVLIPSRSLTIEIRSLNSRTHFSRCSDNKLEGNALKTINAKLEIADNIDVLKRTFSINVGNNYSGIRTPIHIIQSRTHQ
jgi:hypothetical protein